jgi:hypothetical protein
MADIELIVKIPKEKIVIEYGKVISIGRNNDKELADYIFAGTPLPKGHGRLIDADETLKAMDSWDKFGYSCHDMFRLTKDSEKDYVSYVHYADMVKAVNNAPTIIEADKGE